MRRLLMTVLAVCSTVILGACGGGGHSAAGQPDYLERLLLTQCSGARPSTFVPSTSSAALETQANSLSKIDPPDDVIESQRNLVIQLRASAKIVASLKPDERIDPSSASASVIHALGTASVEWSDSVKAHYGYALFTAEGASMEPAYRNGDALMVKAQADPIERWSVLVFKFPLDETRDFVKRVVGLPGETVEIRDGAILINGVARDDDTYALASANYAYGPKIVPANSYFVLGDNRRNSYDSHAWVGSCARDKQCEFVPTKDILGVVTDVHHCSDAKTP